MAAQTQLYEELNEKCICDDPNYIPSKYSDCCCNEGGYSSSYLSSTIPMAENEALRRRIHELETLLARRGLSARGDYPNEFQVLKAENNHFKDLTYSRLAEVEYWKKMYTNERQNYEAKLEALRKEYEDRYDLELKKLKASPDEYAKLQREYNSSMEGKKREWELRFREALADELNRLRSEHMKETQALRDKIAYLESRLGTSVVEFETKEKIMKDRLREVCKREVSKLVAQDLESIKNLSQQNELLEKQLKDKDTFGTVQDQAQLQKLLQAVKAKELAQAQEIAELKAKLSLNSKLPTQVQPSSEFVKELETAQRLNLKLAANNQLLKQEILNVSNDRNDMFSKLSKVIERSSSQDKRVPTKTTILPGTEAVRLERDIQGNIQGRVQHVMVDRLEDPKYQTSQPVYVASQTQEVQAPGSKARIFKGALEDLSKEFQQV